MADRVSLARSSALGVGVGLTAGGLGSWVWLLLNREADCLSLDAESCLTAVALHNQLVEVIALFGAAAFLGGGLLLLVARDLNRKAE